MTKIKKQPETTLKGVKTSSGQKTVPSTRPVKYFDKKLFIISGVLFALLVVIISFFATPQVSQTRLVSEKTAVTAPAGKETISYPGKAGIDALTLLQKQAHVTLAQSGLVTGINGRMADSTKHEYWEFFINGKSADSGPKDYITKKGDVLTWKIATY